MRIEGVGFRVQGGTGRLVVPEHDRLGNEYLGLRFRAQGTGFAVWVSGAGCRVQGAGSKCRIYCVWSTSLGKLVYNFRWRQKNRAIPVNFGRFSTFSFGISLIPFVQSKWFTSF